VPRAAARRCTLATSDDLVERDGQIAHALAGRMEHGIADRGGRARDADLAGALRAERASAWRCRKTR